MGWRALAAVAAVLIAGFVFQGSAQAQKGGGAEIVIRVCNNTNDNARVALSFQPVGQSVFYNEGWFGIPSRSCQELRSTDNAFFYGYAEVENDSSRTWAGDMPLCVQYPGPYAFWTRGDQCERGQEVRQFVTMQARAFGNYTWTLDPP